MILQVKQKAVNRITLYSKYNYAFKNYYYSDVTETPHPTTGSQKNSCIKFYSKQEGIATVNWGDGNVEIYPFLKISQDNYVCAWRTLNIDYLKNPATGKGWGFGNNSETGEENVPYPNHHYADDNTNESRTINITFSNSIYQFTSEVVIMQQFPLLELPFLTQLEITYTYNIKEIPFNRLSKLKDLEVLSLNALDNKDRIEYIPDSIFQLKKLTSLSWDNGLNLRNPESSNIRNIKQLTNLRTLYIRSNQLKYYLKEFNELPNLTRLEIGNGELDPDSPLFDEVTEINQSLTIFNWLQSAGGTMGTKADWSEQISGMGLQNLTYLNVGHGRKLTLNLPQYLKEMRSLSSFRLASSLHTEERINTFTNNFYEYVTSWEEITMSTIAKDHNRNQFYNLTVTTYASTYPDYAHTPSGILQAPEGFVKGTSNGNPTTPMEKIYVLTQNYNQKWTLKPAANTQTAAFTTTRQLAYNQIIDNSMIVSAEGTEYKNEIITLTEEELKMKEESNL